MVTLSITTAGLANPVIAQMIANSNLQHTNSFTLNIGSVTKMPIPSPSKTAGGAPNPSRNGLTYEVQLYPDESFEIDDSIFQGIVQNFYNGGDVGFVTRLIDLVNRGIVQVLQDGAGTPLTAKQILAYTAP